MRSTMASATTHSPALHAPQRAVQHGEVAVQPPPAEIPADVPAGRMAAVKRAQVLAASARMRASVSTSTAWPPTPWSNDLQGWLGSRNAAAIEQELDDYAREVATRSMLNGAQDTTSAERRRGDDVRCG